MNANQLIKHLILLDPKTHITDDDTLYELYTIFEHLGYLVHTEQSIKTAKGLIRALAFARGLLGNTKVEKQIDQYIRDNEL